MLSSVSHCGNVCYIELLHTLCICYSCFPRLYECLCKGLNSMSIFMCEFCFLAHIYIDALGTYKSMFCSFLLYSVSVQPNPTSVEFIVHLGPIWLIFNLMGCIHHQSSENRYIYFIGFETFSKLVFCHVSMQWFSYLGVNLLLSRVLCNSQTRPKGSSFWKTILVIRQIQVGFCCISYCHGGFHRQISVEMP